jgi:2-desacetyl-2-hydroxyethyl bacteriochlorophyllide A dehydrogenase
LSTEGPAPRELWFLAPRAVEVRAGAVPAVGPGQVLARAVASGVSQGTELVLYKGDARSPFDPSLEPPGAPVYPRRYGYAWVGEVLAVGAAVSHLSAGTRVFALAPHGDLHALDASALRPLASALPPRRAVLAASLETAVTCVWDAGASVGDAVVILGGGVIGLLVAFLMGRAGARVRLVEPSERRRAVAAAWGIDVLHPEDDHPSGDADVVVEATGEPAVLDRAIAHAGHESTVVVASFYGARTAPISLGAEFHRRRLVLRSTQVSSIPPGRSPRWTPARRFDVVRALLADARLDALIDPPSSFASAPDVYARLDRSPGDAIQTVFVY